MQKCPRCGKDMVTIGEILESPDVGEFIIPGGVGEEEYLVVLRKIDEYQPSHVAHRKNAYSDRRFLVVVAGVFFSLGVTITLFLDGLGFILISLSLLLALALFFTKYARSDLRERNFKRFDREYEEEMRLWRAMVGRVSGWRICPLDGTIVTDTEDQITIGEFVRLDLMV